MFLSGLMVLKRDWRSMTRQLQPLGSEHHAFDSLADDWNRISTSPKVMPELKVYSIEFLAIVTLPSSSTYISAT